MIENIFFDLDGTLLPSDAEEFTSAYFNALVRAIAPRGYEPKALVDGVWKGTYAMMTNDGSRTNETRFWEVFSSLFGERVKGDLPHFDAFYKSGFNEVKKICHPAAEIGGIVSYLKSRGMKLVLATNPVFPMTAQESRARWAGLSPDDFLHITSYENSSYCKPNPAYYTEICEKCGIDPLKSLMIGNDVREDGAAAKTGMGVFILTPCLIDRDENLAAFPHGGYAELMDYLRNLLEP